MLAAGAFYDFTTWNRNSAAVRNLTEDYQTLTELSPKPSKPGASAENIAAAREQAKQLEQWRVQSKKYFRPIAPIPDASKINDEAFANALRQTIHDLQQKSAAASVTLPPDYGFSFTAQRASVRFPPGSLRPLSEQLGEVKILSEMLFAAGINSLDGVQRVRVSDDDADGPQSDYIDEQPVVNDLAILTPYQITFRAFSSNIAQLLASFGTSPHAFIVKGINVQPADVAGTDAAPPAAPQAGPGRGGLQTVLKEQLLRVTLEVGIVKLK
jgi:hypothetical protein